jgi:hypothetical protein
MNLTNDKLDSLRCFEKFSEKFLLVAPKQPGPLMKFNFNRAQKHLNWKLDEQRTATSGRVRAVIVKGRQLGGSTLVQGRYFHRVITTRGVKAFILTHHQDATENIFGITNRFYNNLPYGLIPKANTKNAKQLHFEEFDSGYSVGTASNPGVGRSSTIQLFHGSEVSLWQYAEEHAKGIMQAISNKSGTEIILESTARGMGNYFHDMWTSAIAGKNGYLPIFLPWYWDDDYKEPSEGLIPDEEEEFLLKIHGKDGLTKENLAWRRIKIREISTKNPDHALEDFQQEYPMNAEEAFKNPVKDTFINSKIVLRARKNNIESYGRLIIGVDVALKNDSTAIIRRQGRVGFKLERFKNYDTMQIAGILKRIIQEENPYKVYVDYIGIGAGVVDRLREMGFYCVEGINVARTANDKEKFRNLRAELWSDMRDWLSGEMPVQIPDEDKLHAELCCLGWSYTSSNQIQIESKEDLKKRGLSSPDGADAFSLTFFGGNFGGESNQIEVPKLSYHERSMFR